MPDVCVGKRKEVGARAHFFCRKPATTAVTPLLLARAPQAGNLPTYMFQNSVALTHDGRAFGVLEFIPINVKSKPRSFSLISPSVLGRRGGRDTERQTEK